MKQNACSVCFRQKMKSYSATDADQKELISKADSQTLRAVNVSCLLDFRNVMRTLLRMIAQSDSLKVIIIYQISNSIAPCL